VKKYFVSFLGIAMCLILLKTTCWGSSDWVTVAEVDASKVFYSTVTYDDQPMAQWEYHLASLKTAQDTEALPFLFPSDKITVKEIETFLSQRNITAKQLYEYISKYQTSLREFIDYADSFGTDTALFIELLDGVNEAAAEQGVEDLFSFLRLTDTSMANFVEVMDQVYGEESAYLKNLIEYQVSLDEWYADYLGSGAKTFSEWLGAGGSGNSTLEPQSPIAVISGIFSVIGIVYDIIKSTNAVNVSEASTRILHKDDTNPMNYASTKKNKTKKWKWLVKNFAGATCFDIQFHAESLYDARHSQHPGSFLPRIKVVVDKVTATFPWSVDAKVTLDKNLGNMGTVAVPNPQGQMDIHVNCHWQVLFFKGFDNRHLTVSFTGDKGITSDW